MSKGWMEFEKYAVWGAGASGLAAARHLEAAGKRVVLSDVCDQARLESLASGLNIELIGGRNAIAGADVVVASPGLPPGLPIFAEARRREVPVISEVQLAMAIADLRWVGITGTDGKSTTTSLVGAIMEAAGLRPLVAGNIGTPLTEVVAEAEADTIVVAELSANQLWTCEDLRLEAGLITNFAEDHQDYFRSLEEYWQAKRRLLTMPSSEAIAVLPLSGEKRFQELLRELKEEGRRIYAFGLEQELDVMPAEWVDKIFYVTEGGEGCMKSGPNEEIWLASFEEVSLLGRHNQRNCAAAAALAATLSVDSEAVAAGLTAFSGLPHRMQVVARTEELTFVDDSKATNSHASLAGIAGLDGEVVVIAGGYDKGLPLETWAKAVAERADAVVLIGELREKLSALLRAHAGVVESAESLEEAVDLAIKRAKPGSTILLSPASSSYDMFDSYVHRGEVFQSAVRSAISRLP